MDSQILQILVTHSIAPNAALLDAMRDVFKAGIASVQAPQGGDGDDDGEDLVAPLTQGDLAALTRLGIDPAKKFLSGRTTFTVTGFKPSRWKYPVSCVNQNGRRFKFTVAQVVTLQKR